MADNKIKVNELQTATPELTDTLLASGAEREYACRISDLKDAIGGGGGVYLVHAEYSENNNGGYVVEVEDDVNDICAAIENGSMCFIKLNPLDEDEYRFVPLYQYYPAIEDGSPYLVFNSSFNSEGDVPGGVLLSRLRIIYNDGSWSFEIQRFEIATLTSSDIS